MDSAVGRSIAYAALLATGIARAAVFDLPPPGEDIVGEPSTIESREGDTLASIAFEHGVGFRQVLHANPELDPWKLPAHSQVVLPTQAMLPTQPREGIVINIPEMRLFYFPSAEDKVYVYPVAVGRVDWRTPLGSTTVVGKVRNPTWYPTDDIRAEHAAENDPLPLAVPPGEDNPLGAFALKLGWKLVLIHGTNKPMGGIGMPVTHGCIRLYPQDIEDLFKRVPVGTKVTVLDQPYKMGRHDSFWYVEAHQPLTAEAQPQKATDVTPTLVKMKARRRASTIDWNLVSAALKRSDGLPTAAEPMPQLEKPAFTAPALATSPRANFAALQTESGADPKAGAATLREKLLLLTLGLLVVLSLLLAVGIARRRRGVGLHRGDFRG